MDDLEAWLDESYETAFRTACLVLRNRADAEEAVQEAFLRTWRFRASVPDGPDGSARKRWLYRVVVNACISRLRANAARPALQREPDREQIEQSPGPDKEAEQALLASSVSAALDSLPEYLRITVVLRYYTGLSEAEIATAINRRQGTVKSRLHEARHRLSTDPHLAAWAEEMFAPQRFEESR